MKLSEAIFRVKELDFRISAGIALLAHYPAHKLTEALQSYEEAINERQQLLDRIEVAKKSNFIQDKSLLEAEKVLEYVELKINMLESLLSNQALDQSQKSKVSGQIDLFTRSKEAFRLSITKSCNEIDLLD